MRYSEIKPQQLNEFVMYFDRIQGTHIVGQTEDGQEVSVDVSKYQIDMPNQNQMITIMDKRPANEKTQLLRALEKGTPIDVTISGTFMAR